MRKIHRNQPIQCEPLEDRMLLSGSDGVLGGLIQTLPVRDAQTVARAVMTFEKAYNTDVQTILAPKGTTNPSANRAAFDARVATELATLNGAIDAAIANITTTANPSLVPTITTDLLGPSTMTTTSLRDALAAVATPASTTRFVVKSFVAKSDKAIDQVGYQVTKLVATATAPTGTITTDAAKTLFQAVDAAFRTFSQSDAAAIPATATSPVTNRAAFDAAVGGLLTTLDASIGAALGQVGLPSSDLNSLIQTVTNDLLTGAQTSGKSLQAQLAAIKSPTSSRGFSMILFKAQSFWTISGGHFQVSKDVVSAINAYNTSLTG
jgi:hypothetical protein